MTEPSFSSLLESIGWSNKELAQRLGRHEQTVSRWHKDGAPDYVMTYLKQIDSLVGKNETQEPG
jgi:IS30 family transposase